VLLLGPLGALLLHRALSDDAPRTATVSAAEARQSADAQFEALLRETQRLLDAKRAEESLAPLQRALQLRPEDARVHNNLCVAYGLLGRRGDAVAACQRALRLDPTMTRAANNLRWVSSLPERPTP